MELRTRQEALSAGLTTYFTGKPCKHGHIAERQVSSFGCMVCARDAFKRWRERNLESQKARITAYVNENREKVNLRKRQIRAANKDKVRAQRRRAYENNPEKHRKRVAAFRARKPETVKASRADWKRRNRALATANQRQREIEKLKATPSWADLDAIRNFYDEAAHRTALTGQPHEVDHVVPLRGKHVCGLHVQNNLQVIPALLNRKKGNRFEDIDDREGNFGFLGN